MKIVLFSLNASRVHTNLAIRCLAESLKQSGFDEVVLSDFCFPNTTEIRFTGNKTQTLNSAAQLLTDTYTSERFVLSFEVTDADFILPEGRTRIYKTGCTAEETNLTTLGIGAEKVDNLDACFENLLRS